MNKKPVNRRSVIKKLGLGASASIAAPSFLAFLQSCAKEAESINWRPKYISKSTANIIEHLAEIMLPKSSTSGAKEAGVAVFVDRFYGETANEKEIKKFDDGIKKFDTLGQSLHQTKFVDLTETQKTTILKTTMEEDLNTDGKLKKDSFSYLFRYMIIVGYCTSEKGAKEALAYLPVPGKYEPCTTIDENTKAWAIK